MKRPPKKKRPQQGERKKEWSRTDKIMLVTSIATIIYYILDLYLR